MQDITFAQVMEICAIVLVLVGAYNAIMTAVKNHREEAKVKSSPVTQLKERVDRHDDLLQKDKDRLDKHDAELEDLGTGLRTLLRSNMAINSHLLTNNSKDKLSASNAEIQNYLVDRK